MRRKYLLSHSSPTSLLKTPRSKFFPSFILKIKMKTLISSPLNPPLNLNLSLSLGRAGPREARRRPARCGGGPGAQAARGWGRGGAAACLLPACSRQQQQLLQAAAAAVAAAAAACCRCQSGRRGGGAAATRRRGGRRWAAQRASEGEGNSLVFVPLFVLWKFWKFLSSKLWNSWISGWVSPHILCYLDVTDW